MSTIALLPAASGQMGGGVNFYSIEKEVAMGRALAQELERQTGILEDPPAQQYLERLGARLVAGLPADAPAFPYTFRLIPATPSDVSEPQSFPGGFIFVPANLIAATPNEAEIAGILAHSIAHVAARHGTRQETRGQIANYATIPLVFMGGGWSGYGNRQSASVLVPLGFLKFARAYELESDRIAVEIMASAGYDPAALLSFVERVQQAPNAATTAQYFSPLPSREERLANLRSAIERLPPQ